MTPEKTTKIMTKRRKFIFVEIPALKSRIELIANSPEELNNKTIKLDLTRQLKGKSIEAVLKIKIENNKAIAYPEKIKLMSYFIRRMIRKRISYVEDSFETPSQENMILIKPFLITRKKVSRAVRKTLRNRTKNWIEDYIAERKNNEIFEEILSNRMQKPLSLMLKKTYPLSLCEIKFIEIKRHLNPEEIPKIKEKPKESQKEKREENEIIDQLKEIEEEEKIKQAEKEIKDVQEKAANIESSFSKEKEIAIQETEPTSTELAAQKPKRGRKKKIKTEENSE
jgi:ribosomal protein S3AE